MAARGSITLGELCRKLDMLEVACKRCDRRGRLSLDRLIAEHGAETGLPDLWGALAGDCPRARYGTVISVVMLAVAATGGLLIRPIEPPRRR